MALTFISGYFISQLFNPVLFATEGPIMAGKMGMTLTALNGILGLSFSWISTKIPKFSCLIAAKNFAELDYNFSIAARQSIFVNIVGLVVMFLGIAILRRFNWPLGDRFLPYLPLILLMLTTLMSQIVTSWATYLRCHKQEPFLLPSIVSGISIGISTVVMGHYFGIVGISISYCILTFLLSIIWGHYIFHSKRKQWHQESIYLVKKEV